ncbi:hypothetical protein GCM10018785_04620 [Streptomyces longispororuber]|uniref:Uncharacterized protein n=1 Tax=Streptomyces longispororuber TaxID=68230 RepID=A0A919DD77_9ACTN|nr:hypothetical protein [Streptomyces longispororuber]GHE38084.1 hypothetical protein GCM10018785_04620 [Streptomyces longispororuber]
MSSLEFGPRDAARWAARAGLPLPDERLDLVAATARHIHAVVATLRELDLTGVEPTPAGAEVRDAAV